MWSEKAKEAVGCPYGNPQLSSMVLQLGLNNIPLLPFFNTNSRLTMMPESHMMVEQLHKPRISRIPTHTSPSLSMDTPYSRLDAPALLCISAELRTSDFRNSNLNFRNQI